MASTTIMAIILTRVMQPWMTGRKTGVPPTLSCPQKLQEKLACIYNTILDLLLWAGMFCDQKTGNMGRN